MKTFPPYIIQIDAMREGSIKRWERERSEHPERFTPEYKKQLQAQRMKRYSERVKKRPDQLERVRQRARETAAIRARLGPGKHSPELRQVALLDYYLRLNLLKGNGYEYRRGTAGFTVTNPRTTSRDSEPCYCKCHKPVGKCPAIERPTRAKLRARNRNDP